MHFSAIRGDTPNWKIKKKKEENKKRKENWNKICDKNKKIYFQRHASNKKIIKKEEISENV